MNAAVPQIISRAEAKARGLKRYFTGKPCPYGHAAERSTHNGHCLKCVKEYLSRPEVKRKSIARSRKYYYLNRERYLAVSAEYKRKNPERTKAHLEAFFKRHKDYKKQHHKKTYNPKKRRERLRYGPPNPTGEKQWLRKNFAQLRAVRRLLRNPQLAASLSPSEVSALGLTLRT